MKLVGMPIRLDQAATPKDMLGYARYLVELDVDGPSLEEIRFSSEAGILPSQKVHYEWKPIKCSKCKMIRHNVEHCIKKGGKKVWKPKVTKEPKETAPKELGPKRTAPNKIAPEINSEVHSIKHPILYGTSRR